MRAFWWQALKACTLQVPIRGCSLAYEVQLSEPQGCASGLKGIEIGHFSFVRLVMACFMISLAIFRAMVARGFAATATIWWRALLCSCLGCNSLSLGIGSDMSSIFSLLFVFALARSLPRFGGHDAVFTHESAWARVMSVWPRRVSLLNQCSRCGCRSLRPHFHTPLPSCSIVCTILARISRRHQPDLHVLTTIIQHSRSGVLSYHMMCPWMSLIATTRCCAAAMRLLKRAQSLEIQGNSALMYLFLCVFRPKTTHMLQNRELPHRI